jgi:hypothetical protein
LDLSPFIAHARLPWPVDQDDRSEAATPSSLWRGTVQLAAMIARSFIGFRQALALLAREIRESF